MRSTLAKAIFSFDYDAILFHLNRMINIYGSFNCVCPKFNNVNMQYILKERVLFFSSVLSFFPFILGVLENIPTLFALVEGKPVYMVLSSNM